MISQYHNRRRICLVIIHEPYRAEIEELYHNNNNTIDYVISQLQVHHRLQVKTTALKDRFRKWGIRRRNLALTADEAPHSRIFFLASLDEKDLLRVLQEDGHKITLSATTEATWPLSSCGQSSNGSVDGQAAMQSFVDNF